MATNRQLISEALDFQQATGGENFAWDGHNLNTFAEWAKNGMIVKKGEKAFLSVKLWKPVEKKVKDENGNDKKETQFILKLCHLFTADQVEAGEYVKRSAKKKPAKRKTAAAKKKTA